LHFIKDIRNASLNDGVGITGEPLECLHNPPQEPLHVDDLSTELTLSMFLALKHSSENAYTKIQRAIVGNKFEFPGEFAFPDCELPMFHQTKCLLANLSGVPSVVKDMCTNSCTVRAPSCTTTSGGTGRYFTAFVGLLSALNTCPECSELQYDQVKLQWRNSRIKHPHAVFHTIPIAPQLQA
ncbi:hypothetical protein M404DRAFT_92091, partial [Pisolithus tinctorius Marx 270]